MSGILILTILIVAFVAVAVLDRDPLVYYKTELSDADLARAKSLLRNHDPRTYRAGTSKRISLSQNDVNLIVNYGLRKSPVQAHANIKLFNESVMASSSIQLPAPLDGYVVNASLGLVQKPGLDFEVESLKLGAIELNGTLANWMVNRIYKTANHKYPEIGLVTGSIKSVHLVTDAVTIEYSASKDVLAQLKQRGSDYLLPPDMKARLAVYQQALVLIARDNTLQNPSLLYLVQPMLQLADQRAAANHEYTEESRAVLLAMAMYVLGRDIQNYVALGVDARPKFITYTLNDRDDLPKHFLVSAALVVLADDALANLVGLQKEVLDSKGGSGFSFADLAADRAGTRMANLLLSDSTAPMFLDNMMNARQERDFMPDTSTLPEGFQQLDFNRLYKNTNSAEYMTVVNRIDELISSCAVFTGFS
jgi:hypothetical protein